MRAPSDEGQGQYGPRRPEPTDTGGSAPSDAPASAPTTETPTGTSGSEPPPPSAGDESPDPSFPVPPVPPPPAPGPVFSLAGGGGGGAASFARPGTSAAKPFRSQLFGTNRSTTGAAPVDRFGAGAPITTGGTPPFLPAGLDSGSPSTPGAGGDEELQRILALLRGGGAGA